MQSLGARTNGRTATNIRTPLCGFCFLFFFFLIAYIIYESVILVDTRRAGHPAECRDLKSVQRRMGITFTVGAKDVY
jgi:hypothetical protein